MQKDQRNQTLVAVENKARRLLRTLRVNHTTKLSAPVATRCGRGLVLLLVSHNAHGIAANARITTDQRAPITRAVLVKF